VATVGTGIWVASDADLLFNYSNKKSVEHNHKEREFILSEWDPFGHVEDNTTAKQHVLPTAGTQYRDKLVPKQNVRDVTA
jgi:hypothetical protein